ncbi:GntP family permease [Siculibacillus lacustris]|uniref:GntP family permease n=1 Tax=Siculibacillus lacustris TaxID=1549641 RepID=A0A4Q9VNR5_9HYPH|nr:GntP family permease [Siculibacillus lacustris]TBW37343.1 GntP family permease [Siculibacillus lacustris]
MSFLVCILSLALLMFVAYRGFSVILFAPLCALGAVFITEPTLVMPVYSGLFMSKMVVFVENYFPLFLLGAVFGKVIEMSGFAQSIVAAVVKIIGAQRAILAIILVGAILTYGGVSLFVVVFAVYPFAAELFKRCDIPKNIIPAVVIVGGATFTMDALPGTPAIQNVIPTTFFKTTIYAAPILGIIGAIFIFASSYAYLEWVRRRAVAKGLGYSGACQLREEPATLANDSLVNPWVAVSPLVLVGVLNYVFTKMLPVWYPAEINVTMNAITKPFVVKLSSMLGLWSVEISLTIAIILVCIISFKTIKEKFAGGSYAAVQGALLATMNTATEYGYGAVIAALPGFIVIRDALTSIPNPLLNEAITINVLAGIVGSASGGMGIALAAMADSFVAAANAAHIPLEVLHRVASMASGGMDSLPHNGAVITIMMACGLTHREAYPHIFAVVCCKTVAAFAIIAVYYMTGLV